MGEPVGRRSLLLDLNRDHGPGCSSVRSVFKEGFPRHLWRVGKRLVMNGYTFRVVYVGQAILKLDPVGPDQYEVNP